MEILEIKDLKLCPKCDTEKPKNEFVLTGTRLQSYCKQCTNDIVKARHRKSKSEFNGWF